MYTELPIQLVPGTKRPGRESCHSPLSTAEFKNAWSRWLLSNIQHHGMMLDSTQGEMYLYVHQPSARPRLYQEDVLAFVYLSGYNFNQHFA